MIHDELWDFCLFNSFITASISLKMSNEVGKLRYRAFGGTQSMPRNGS